MVREHGKPPVRGKTSPYGFFVKMCYEEHKKKYPNENVQVTEISKKCSEKWKTMTDDEKRRFFELAQKDAERYQAEVAAYGGEDALRKRKRAKKDPNAPKRALSAFFFFSHDKRPEVQQAHPEWKVGQVAQELGRFWKALSDDERTVYEQRAVRDKERYAEEMRNYKATGKLPPSRDPNNINSTGAHGGPPGHVGGGLVHVPSDPVAAAAMAAAAAAAGVTLPGHAGHPGVSMQQQQPHDFQDHLEDDDEDDEGDE